MTLAEFWTDYIWPLVVIVAQSVLLLVVMIGAAYLAKGRKREDKTIVVGPGGSPMRAPGWAPHGAGPGPRRVVRALLPLAGAGLPRSAPGRPTAIPACAGSRR